MQKQNMCDGEDDPMGVAAIRQDRRGGRTRSRRVLSLWFVIWLSGCVLIVVAFSGWSLLTGSLLFDKLSRSSLPAAVHMRF
jgi:hypothetical protein